jgi:tetratricopeptide (TPR) repeat protein
MRHFFQTLHHEDETEAKPRPRRRLFRTGSWTAGARLRAVAASLGLLASFVVLGSPDTTERLLERCRRAPVPAGDRQSVEVLLRRIDWSATNGQAAEVARLCAALEELHPGDPSVAEAQVRRIDALMTLGDQAGVVEELHRCLQRDARNPQLRELLLDVASWQFAGGAWRDAAQTYTDLVAVATRADAWTVGEDASPAAPLGRSLRRWRAHQSAERGRMDTERLARFNQALAFERAGEFDAAERAYARFAARFPEDSLRCEARLRGATLALHRGDLETARRGFRTVMNDTLAASALRCESIYRAGRCEEALQSPGAAAATYVQALPLRPATDAFRMAALTAAAPLLEDRAPERAAGIYRELITLSTDAAVRAAAQARLRTLEPSAALTTAVR